MGVLVVPCLGGFPATRGALPRPPLHSSPPILQGQNSLACPPPHPKGGLTWLWLDSPYVAAARKLFNLAVEANDAGNPFPIHGTCLGGFRAAARGTAGSSALLLPKLPHPFQTWRARPTSRPGQ